MLRNGDFDRPPRMFGIWNAVQGNWEPTKVICRRAGMDYQDTQQLLILENMGYVEKRIDPQGGRGGGGYEWRLT